MLPPSIATVQLDRAFWTRQNKFGFLILLVARDCGSGGFAAGGGRRRRGDGYILLPRPRRLLRLLWQLRLPDLLGTSSLKKRTVKERPIRNAHSHNYQAGVADGTYCDPFIAS